MKSILILILIVFAMPACKPMQKNGDKNVPSVPAKTTEFFAALPHVIIYKTKKDYSHRVPVILSEDKMQILSYPHPTDLVLGEKLALPMPLHKGYLLDNRGIGKHVAFLKYTYEAYSKLKDAPTITELNNNIMDSDPLTELWDCGKKSDFGDLERELNDYIDKDLLSEKFKRIR